PAAADHTIEGVRPGPPPLVRSALPVRQVVPALVAGSRPVRDLVAAVAGVGQCQDGVVVLGRGAILVLPRPDAVAPAACALRGGQVVAGRTRQALSIGVVERERV